MSVKLGIDVGGTFTDVVAILPGGERHYRKVSSTPADQSIGVVHGILRTLETLGVAPSDVDEIVHGTTVATNTLLERAGAPTALITTHGFRDALYIGRQNRPGLYDLYAERMEPLVTREFRVEVVERTLFTGEILQPLDEEELSRLVLDLQQREIKSIAVAFLHSYANRHNEERARAVIGRVAPDMPVSISSDIVPEFREFERMNTTVLNAYVQPGMRNYLSRLAGRLADAGIDAPLLIMQSSGGMMTVEAAGSRSVQTLLSGPAGGVLAAQYLADVIGDKSFITADLGGTSFDVAIVERGRISTITEGEIEGYPVKFPHIDIKTIGAGGGSIAWIDTGGALRVGPRSAGADPGPVSYGRGGKEPTVTDANAVLGRISPVLSGGELALDIDAARDAVRTRIAEPLGLGVEAAAEGILRVVNANMVRAIRVMTIERGIDPRHFVLLPFGGAGALHGSELGRTLGLRRAIVPIAPGNFSAIGLLAAPVRYDRVQNYQVRDVEFEPAAIQQRFQNLQYIVEEQLRADRIESSDVVIHRRADLRYLGQAFELTVDVPSGILDQETLAAVIADFHESHERHYGFQKPGETVELVNLRVSLLAATQGTRQAPSVAVAEVMPEPVEIRPVYFHGSWFQTPLYLRDDLRHGHTFAGPAIVQESGSTTVASPGDQVTVDTAGNLVLDLTDVLASDT
ncbi:MAG: hydantoinase/oxoprolinase family protein [Propionicimonas sp.]